MKQVFLVGPLNYTRLICSDDACFFFLPIQWMETGRCGVSGLCAVQNASIWEFGNVLRHLQETEGSTARAWVKSQRIALKGFAFKVSNSWHWIGFRRYGLNVYCNPGNVAYLPHTHVSRTLLAEILLWKNRLFSEGCICEVCNPQWFLSHWICVAHTLPINYQMILKIQIKAFCNV